MYFSTISEQKTCWKPDEVSLDDYLRMSQSNELIKPFLWLWKKSWFKVNPRSSHGCPNFQINQNFHDFCCDLFSVIWWRGKNIPDATKWHSNPYSHESDGASWLAIFLWETNRILVPAQWDVERGYPNITVPTCTNCWWKNSGIYIYLYIYIEVLVNDLPSLSGRKPTINTYHLSNLRRWSDQFPSLVPRRNSSITTRFTGVD